MALGDKNTSDDFPDEPVQDYYPSCKVKLVIRFDELGRQVFSGKIQPKPTKWFAGIKDKKAPLAVVNDPTAPEGTSRLLLQIDSSKPPLPGISPSNKIKGEDGLTHAIVVVPKDVAWAQNGIRAADTLSLTFKYVDLPIDPRAVRSCAVELYLGTITAEEMQAGIEGTQRQLSNGQSEPMNLIADEFVDAHGRTRSNLRFQGFVDKWDVDWTSESEPVVRVECRDNTQMLIDAEAPAKLVIDGARQTIGQLTGTSAGSGTPIDVAIATYLSHFVQFAGLTVEYRPSTEKPPSISKAFTKGAYRPQLGPPPTAMNGSMTSLSVWDYLTDVAGAIGHIVRMEGTSLVVQKPRNLTSSKAEQRSDDPFEPRQGVGHRRMIFGRNILDLKISRGFTRPSTPKNIEVRCWSPKQKKLLVGRFPYRAPGVTTNPNGPVYKGYPGDAIDEDWAVRYVQGIEDVAVLRVIAQTIYEMTGRNELTVRIKTKNLASFGGGNLDPDLLDMRAGDNFELLVHKDNEEASTATKVDTFLMLQQKSETFLARLGFDPEFASAYAKTFVDLGFQTTFRSKTIGIGWSPDEGVTIEVEGINYMEVRADRLLPGPDGEVSI